MGYAFISYSTKNQETADAIRNTFIANKIDTWMAPYSIPPGSKYAQSITSAIRHCSCFVLLLSNASQASEAVDSEVELAALTFKKNIVTVQIEDVVLNDAFTFYIHNKQILPLDRVDVASSAMKAVLSTVIAFAGQTLKAPPQKNPDSFSYPSSQNPPSSYQPVNNPSNTSSGYAHKPIPTGTNNGQPAGYGGAQQYPQGRPQYPSGGGYGSAPYGTNGQQMPPYGQQPPYNPNPQPTHYGPQKNKIVAAILAFLLGGIGVHYFYLRKYGLGILSILFCWTYIPAFVAVIQAIIYLCTDDQTFNRKYNNR